jgi:hypothetical protein
MGVPIPALYRNANSQHIKCCANSFCTPMGWCCSMEYAVLLCAPVTELDKINGLDPLLHVLFQF